MSIVRYDIVFLDADETLFDFSKAEGFALREAFALRGIAVSDYTVAEYDRINKGLWKAFERGETTQEKLKTERFRILFSGMGLDLDAAGFGHDYLELLSRGSFLFDGAEELCEYLARNCRLVLLTNGIARVQRPRFEASPILKYFEAVVISEEAGASKPDPAIFLHACERLGIFSPGPEEKSRMIMVGDSTSSDIKGGIDFGIDTCWVNLRGVDDAEGWNAGAKHVIHALEELKAILQTRA
jgi:YjjG family noncanonical pyrimidine nucleotidase